MPWIQLQIPADPDNADQLEDLLMEMGSDAVSMEDAADQAPVRARPGAPPLSGARPPSPDYSTPIGISNSYAPISGMPGTSEPSRRFPKSK